MRGRSPFSSSILKAHEFKIGNFLWHGDHGGQCRITGVVPERIEGEPHHRFVVVDRWGKPHVALIGDEENISLVHETRDGWRV